MWWNHELFTEKMQENDGKSTNKRENSRGTQRKSLVRIVTTSYKERNDTIIEFHS